MAFDTLIRGGMVVDGSGQPRFQADVGVSRGRIEAVGRLDRAEAARVIDASGLVVTPGFIDMHSHSDVTLLDDPGGESKAHQGVTTEVTGNCSYSPFPSGDVPPGDVQEIMGFTMASETEWDWTTMDEWASRMEANGVGINVAAQLGQSPLRIAVGATDDRPATPDEVRAMKRLAEESIEQGAFSITTGLTITPSCYAPTDEIVELCKSVARYDGAFYATHARSGPGRHFTMIEEAAEIGKRAGLPVQFSHIGITESYLYGKGHELIAVFERARSEGVDMVFDMYPYTAAGIDLHQVVPVWVREGGVEETMARLEDPSTRDRARRETNEGADGREPPDWDSIVISSVLTERNAGAVGRSVRQISDDTEEDPAEATLRLMHEERDIVSAVIHNRREGDVRYFLAQPMGMIGSDGNAISPNGRLASTVPHPRFYGTYPRVLGRYVREQPAVMTLEEAVFKCAGFPAQRLGLEDRGLLREGLIADLVVFDPDTVIDRATFEQPQQYPDGIPYVIVAGTPVVWEGKNTGARPGRVLRRGE